MSRFALSVALLTAGAGLSCGDISFSKPGTAAVSRTATVPEVATAKSAPQPPKASASKPLQKTRSEPLPAGTDLILITIDTLRADALGFSGNTEVSTPHLDKLAREGRYFTSAYAHNVVTLPSHANILTGLYPYEHGIRENSGFQLPPDVPTLATLLKAQGYATGAFVAAFPLDERFGLGRGFDVYDDRYPSGSHADQFLAAERRGDTVVSLAVSWWRQNAGRPRFLWLHLYDPHAPYQAPEPFASRWPQRPYLAEVAATDAFLAPLLELLASAPRRPFLVVTSDHGEALGDHGELTHGLFCYEATLKVPLLLWGAGVEPGRDDRLVGHVDIAPTVLDLFGLDVPREMSGRSLLAPGSSQEKARTVYFESLSSFFNRGWAPLRGLIGGSLKMIELPLPELYDLERDPAEKINLFARSRDRFNKLRGALPREAAWPPEERPVTPEEIAALRSLGYVASSASRRAGFRPEDDPKNLVKLDQKLQKIIIAYTEGRLEEAESLARQAIKSRPEMALGYEHLALVLRQMERPGDAIAALRAGLERGIADESLLRHLGWTYAENGFAEEAIEILQPFAEGDDIETLNALGIAFSDAGKHSDGLRVLRRALGLDPDEPKTLETLGVVTLRVREVVAAKRYLKRALELNGNLPFAWNTLGVAHAFEGDHESAIAAWEKAIALDDRLFDALYNLGMTAVRTGDRARARRALERYVAIAPEKRFGPDLEKARRALVDL